ncbi:MAG: flagellar biosynthesis protein FlhF [Phycisphaerales bacterium]|nr:flagellar biosynthesis protein FlhF [Phycisphaerales bacterium]
MNLQTFRAPTMAECLAEVKRVMGPDAVILHTRTLTIKRFLGLKRREIVEITAGRGLNGGPRGNQRRPSQMRAASGGGGGGGYSDSGAGTVTAVAPRPSGTVNVSAREPIGAGGQLPYGGGTAGANDSPAMTDLFDQVKNLRDMMKEMQQRDRLKDAPDVPAELFDEYQLLIDNQVERELSEEIIRTIHRSLRPDHLAQKQFVREKIAEQLEKHLPTSGPIQRIKAHGPHVVALIGPTGVGKTTTIAKLAAKLKLDEKRKVGLITIDTYRIAAIDQLKKYADIIKTPLKVVGSPEDLRDAVTAMVDCDFVLIDTAGRSPKDTLKLNELKTFLDAARPEEVHLVLSSTASRQCAELAIERFGDVRIDKLIFTKLDEAPNVGTVMGVVRAVKKPLSYVTTGQDVPADIEVARGKRVAQLILGSEL